MNQAEVIGNLCEDILMKGNEIYEMNSVLGHGYTLVRLTGQRTSWADEMNFCKE